MRAVVVEQHGGPEVLTVVDRPVPEPGPGEALVRVGAAGVNFIDIYQRTGAYPMDLPYVVGLEGAGTVDAVGEGVAPDLVGRRVGWVMVNGTGYTEVAVVPADRLVPLPDEVDDERAAAVLLQGMTAHFLAESTYPARSGETALVHAAAGGVGQLLCQLLSAKGVRVVATTSTEAKAELAREAGADEVILYREEDLVAGVRRRCGDRGVDVVYDGVGRDTFDAGLEVLRPRGTMVLFGASSGPVPPLDPQRLNAAGSLYLTRPSLTHYVAERTELEQRADAVLSAVADGRLRVRIGGRYPMEDAARAQTDLGSGSTTGKLLVLP